MSRKFIFILTLLVALPLAALIALSWRLVVAEQARTEEQFEDLLKASLVELDRDIADYFYALEDRLLGLELNESDPESIRAIVRADPLLDQIVILSAEGRILHPDMETLSQKESRFLLKVEPILIDRMFSPTASNPSMAQQGLVAQAAAESLPQNVAPEAQHTSAAQVYRSNELFEDHLDYGWYTWYWGTGMQLIHWRHLSRGDTVLTVLVGIRRARWMADVIARLPDSTPQDESGASPIQIRLADSDGDVVYQWGASPGVDGKRPIVSIHLSSPLKPWQLQHFGPVDPIQIGSAASRLNLLLGGGLLSLGILGLAIYLGREIGRQTREARERVNFVNQVSHELKTPLTNIRMYADLVAQDLERIDPDDERAASHVSVITRESSRLSRLINNVLTFAGRNQVHAKQRPQPGCVDDVIEGVIAQYRPSLEGLGMEVVMDLDASQQVMIDVDAVEQMLGNLISNAEKYASAGKHLRIRSRHQNGMTKIDVADAGPGVSHAFAKHIFKPFERASDHIRSATGTGIGLTITRNLAHRHGGDLELLDSAIGATFRLTIQTPLCDEGA